MTELLLDACVMINLAATELPLPELAESNEVTFRMTSVTAAEVLYLIDESGQPEAIDLNAIIDRGEIQLVDLTEDEQQQFIGLARDLDDGEAAALAVAAVRRWRVATDDRKARRLARSLQPPLDPVSTSALLHRWAADQSKRADRVAAVLQMIEERASFMPPRDDPLRNWWIATRGRTG